MIGYMFRIKIRKRQMRNLAKYFRENLGAPCIITFIALLLASAICLSLGMSREAEDLAVIAYFMLVVSIPFKLASHILESRRSRERSG